MCCQFNFTDNVEEASNDSTSSHTQEETMSTISKKLSNKIYKLCQKRSNVRSIVWDVFFPVQDETGTIMPHIFACSFCNKVVRHTVKTTSALLSHLCVRNLNTPSAAAPIVRVKLVGDDRKRSVLTFIKFIIVDGQPLKVVEGSGFKAMLQFAVEMGHKYGGNLDIDDFIPQRAILAQNITNLKKKFDITIRKDIALHARNGYSLTSDLWNDKNNSEHFLGLTICFMKNEELVNYTLAVKAMDHEKSTGLDIAKKAKSILQDYDLAKSYKDDAVMVTGRSSNMIAAFQSIELERLNCAAQLMDSTLSEAIEDAGEPITTLLIQCRKVVLFMKKSGQHQTMFDTSLKSDCPARWYSCYFMCHSVFANHKKLVDTLSVISSKASLISKIDYDLLSQLTTLLGFFKSSSEILEAAKAPTIHLVYPAIVHLETACKPNDDDLQPIANLKADLLNRIKKTFRANISTYHRAAVLLNPLSNQLRVLTETEANEAIAYVKAAMVNLERQPTAKAKPVATGRVISKNYHNLMKYNTKTPTTTQSQGLREAFSASFSVAPMTSSSVESIEEELNRYKRQLFYVPTGQNPLHFDTLAFWQQHKTDYPRLAAVAQTLFAIPATSSAAERVFSKDRNLITDYRSNLSAANINDLLSITANAEYVEWEQEHFEI